MKSTSFHPLRVALAPSEVLSTSFASGSVYLGLGVCGLSSEICTGCCSRVVLQTGLGSQCEMALGHLWGQKRKVADTPQPAGKASVPPGIRNPSDKAGRGKRRGQGTEKQTNFLMGLGQPRSRCIGSERVPTSGPARLWL